MAGFQRVKQVWQAADDTGRRGYGAVTSGALLLVLAVLVINSEAWQGAPWPSELSGDPTLAELGQVHLSTLVGLLAVYLLIGAALYALVRIVKGVVLLALSKRPSTV